MNRDEEVFLSGCRSILRREVIDGKSGFDRFAYSNER